MMATTAKRRVGGRLSQLSIDLWKRIRDAGGWWTTSEVVRASGVEARLVSNSLGSLVRGNYVTQRLDRQTGLVRIGVTLFCDAPHGDSLQPGPLPAELEPAWGG